MKACPGAAWPAQTERWRRAAVAGDTRRVGSETGRPLNVAIQFVSRAMQCLTTSFPIDLTAKPWLQLVNRLNKKILALCTSFNFRSRIMLQFSTEME